MHSPHRSLCRLLEPWARAAALALALVFAAAPAAPAQPRRTPDAPGGAAIPPAARVTVHPRNVIAPPGYIARRTLPDSVLLRIDGREDVTIRRYRRAVRLLGGDPDSLTPADRDRFLNLVVQQRVLAAHAMRHPVAWSAADSGHYLLERDEILVRAALSDRLTALESRRRAAGQPDLDEQALGVAARDSLLHALAPVWDEPLLARVARAFASLPEPTAQMGAREQMALMARMPDVAPGDTGRVLVRTSLGEFRVAELLGDYRRLASMYRPRVSDADAVRALVANSLFERTVREEAQAPALERRSEVAAVIADRVEYHTVNSYLQSRVVASIPSDSLTLVRHYQAHRGDFDRPARAVLVMLMLGDRRSADSVARVFRVPGEAESLAFRAQRSGVNYTHMVTAATDSEMYARSLAVGAGGVSGPDSLASGWRVFRVLSTTPRTTQPFAAVREQVQQAWYEQESERRVRALLDQLQRAARVERNDKALRGIVLAAAGARR